MTSARLGESENTINPKAATNLPPTTNRWKEDKENIVEGKNRVQIRNKKALALLLKPVSVTPSNTGSLRTFHRNTGRSTRSCGAEKFCNEEAKTSTDESNQSTTSNSRFTYSKGNAPLRSCIGLLLILNTIQNTATDYRLARQYCNTYRLLKKLALLIPVSTRWRCESAAQHHTAEQYSKKGRLIIQKDHRRSDRSWNTCQNFLIIPILWAAALETERT